MVFAELIFHSVWKPGIIAHRKSEELANPPERRIHTPPSSAITLLTRSRNTLHVPDRQLVRGQAISSTQGTPHLLRRDIRPPDRIGIEPADPRNASDSDYCASCIINNCSCTKLDFNRRWYAPEINCWVSKFFVSPDANISLPSGGLVRRVKSIPRSVSRS